MKSRERWALVKALVLVGIVLALTVWFLMREPIEATSGEPTDSDEPSVQVTMLVELTSEQLPEVPPAPQPAETKSERASPPSPPAGSGGLASHIEDDGTTIAPLTEEIAERVVSADDTARQDDTASPESDPSESSPDAMPDRETPDAEPGEVPEEPIPDDLADHPEPSPPPASARPAASAGSMPMLVNTGDTEALAAAYPRMEVVWVNEEKPIAGETQPRVFLEAVLTKDGRVLWENLRTGAAARGFDYATERYDRSGQVRAPDPSQLGLWQFREEIAGLAKVKPDDWAQFAWGYYRHRAEVYYLSQIRQAFLKMQADHLLEFDPARGDVIEVQWENDPQDGPSIASARFVANDGSPAIIMAINFEQ